MAPLVSVEELQTRPDMADVGTAEAEALLADASALVRLVAQGELDDVDHESGDRPAAIVPVVVSICRRAQSNPLGRSGETLGDYTWHSSGSGMSGPYVTRREKTLIRRVAAVLGVSGVQLEAYLPLPPEFGGSSSLIGS